MASSVRVGDEDDDTNADVPCSSEETPKTAKQNFTDQDLARLDMFDGNI